MKNTKLKQIKKTSTKKTVKKDTVTISVVLNQSLYNDFNNLAKQQDRKLASLVRMLIKRELADFGLRKYDKCD